MITTRTRHTVAALGTAIVMAVLVLACAQAMADEAFAPLPPSAYTVKPACPPPAPGFAACLALRLVPRNAKAQTAHPPAIAGARPQRAGSPATGAFGYTPQDGYTPADLHTGYQLPLGVAPTQTIALVDAYNDLTAEPDLGTYDAEFLLPECTTADKCFTEVNQNGEPNKPPFPQKQSNLTSERGMCSAGQRAACVLVKEAEGWAVEISLDIETARAVCQNCHIMLVEANSPAYANLEAAEDTAVRLGAGEVSNSWAGPECVYGTCVPDSPAFEHPGTVITAAAGDDGYRNWLEEPRTATANFPASSPHVVAVGGTRLMLTAEGAWAGETVWNDGGESGGFKEGHGAAGGGCSAQLTAPPWQQAVADWSSVGCADKRAIADIAADADPYTGVAIYDSQGMGEGEEWGAVGGTSLASPLIASTFALAGGAHGVAYPARTLYEGAKSSDPPHDVTAGSNGECLSPFDEAKAETACTPAEEAATSCSSQLICQAATGYDGPTGVGTPDGTSAFEATPGAGREEQEEESRAAETGATSGGTAGRGGGSAPVPPGSSGASGSASSPPPSAAPAQPNALATAPAVQLSGLALTLKAVSALNSSRPRIDQLAFTFTLNVAARIRLSLEQRVGKRGHKHWKATAQTLTIAAVSGRNSRRLTGHGPLRSGAYRLTLAPVGGTARSLVFKIG